MFYKLPLARLKRFGDPKSKVTPTFFNDFHNKKLPIFMILYKKGDHYVELLSGIAIYPSSLKHLSTALFFDESDLKEVNKIQIKHIIGGLTDAEKNKIYYEYLPAFYENGYHFSPNKTSLIR